MAERLTERSAVVHQRTVCRSRKIIHSNIFLLGGVKKCEIWPLLVFEVLEFQNQATYLKCEISIRSAYESPDCNPSLISVGPPILRIRHLNIAPLKWARKLCQSPNIRSDLTPKVCQRLGSMLNSTPQLTICSPSPSFLQGVKSIQFSLDF